MNDFHCIGQLGQFSLQVAMSICVSVCLSVPHFAIFDVLLLPFTKVRGSIDRFQKAFKNHKTLPREHLIGCQGVKMFLLKNPFKIFSSLKWRFVTIEVLLYFEFLSFRVLSQFGFCRILSFRVLSQLEFYQTLRFVTI